MPIGKAQWHTPGSVIKNKEEVWALIEKKGWAAPKVDLEKEIKYFDNPQTYHFTQEYDLFFAYTKVFPLWDQRKCKDNGPYPPDIHENIYQQEKDKPVPALTSQNYGRRPSLDYRETGYNRLHATGDFYRRRGVMRPIERKVQ